MEYIEYLSSPHFLEATLENWESEFLQMFLFVALFSIRRAWRSPRSWEKAEPVELRPSPIAAQKGRAMAGAQGGVILNVYEYSVSIAFFLLFLASFLISTSR